MNEMWAEDHLALVTDLARSLFDDSVAIAVRDPRRMPRAPEPAEAEAMVGAVAARQTEFHAGRAAARAAMVALGLPPRPVPMGPDRAPIWPEGIVGSISHDPHGCVAALARAQAWRAIGVDLEPDTALEADLVAEVCTEREQAWLAGFSKARRGNLAKLIFSAKEAAYKAQFPLTEQVFGFDSLEVEIDEADTRFDARFVREIGEFSAGDVISGNYAHAAGVIVSGIALPHLDGR